MNNKKGLKEKDIGEENMTLNNVEIQEDKRVKEKLFYLTNTNTHCKTPAVPVHTEGPVFTSESCTRRPTEAARETKDTTYAKNSQSFNLWS